MTSEIHPSVVEKGGLVEPVLAAATEFPPASPPAPGRLASLDAFRGFIMFWIVGGGGLMLGLQRLGHNFLIDTIVYQLNHTPWKGLRFYDCIWPSFMLMVGMSVPFSFAMRSKTHMPEQLRAHALKRAVVLFLLGSVRESVFLGSPCLIELSSALQPIAIAYFVAYLLARKPPRIQAAVGAAIVFSYALLLALVPAPGIPAGTYELNHNLVNYVDVALLGTQWAVWPYAPEGWGTVLSTIPTISTTILGLLIGELLISDQPAKSKMKVIAYVAVGGLILGYGLSPVIPVVMKMWTTSYGILSAAWACLMFLFFYWAIDVRGFRKWAFPFAVIGMNALAAYLAATFTRLEEIIEILSKAWNPYLRAFAPLTSAILLIGVEWAILYWMYRRKIFLRV